MVDKSCYGATDTGRMWYGTFAGVLRETLRVRTLIVDFATISRHTRRADTRTSRRSRAHHPHHQRRRTPRAFVHTAACEFHTHRLLRRLARPRDAPGRVRLLQVAVGRLHRRPWGLRLRVLAGAAVDGTLGVLVRAHCIHYPYQEPAPDPSPRRLRTRRFAADQRGPPRQHERYYDAIGDGDIVAQDIGTT